MMTKNNKWVSLEKERPPRGVAVLVYSDVFDRYSISSIRCSYSETDDEWKNGIPAMSHWQHIPKPPWWCFQCMGIPIGTMISTHTNTAICISCGRDVEKERRDFERIG